MRRSERRGGVNGTRRKLPSEKPIHRQSHHLPTPPSLIHHSFSMSASSERPTKRARSAVACRRCKHRKQRCDNTFPACAACVSAGETCSYDSKVHPPEYVESLERRVADLEHSLQAAPNHMSDATRQHEHTPTSTSRNEAPFPPTSNDVAAEETGFDMLSPGSSFLGTSSGYPLAQAVHAVVAREPTKSTRAQHQHVTATNVTEARLPNGSLGNKLIQVYFAKVHPKHPFLSSQHIGRLHDQREGLREKVPDKPLLTRLHSFQLCMVYAIGARYHQLSQNEYSCSPDAYHAAAMQELDAIFQTSSLEALEGMLLLTLFQLRSSKPAEIWSIIGITMRHAISLGLHRKFGGSRSLDQRRKRLFWTIFMLEQSIARTMGRPMSISNRDIDVELPANVDENIEIDGEIEPAFSQDRGPTTMSAVIHIFRLAQLESRIYSSVHRVDRPPPDETKVARLRCSLNEWRDQIPLHVPSCQDESENEAYLTHYYADSTYHILHYHLALLLLLLPRLTTLPATHEDFKTCLASAGQVCQLYKRLHNRQTILAYSIIALHATFVAGLTLIYCFISDPAVLDMRFTSDIRACSNVLLLISERWPAAKKVRDAFERMLSRTVENPDFPVGRRPVSNGAALGGNDAEAASTEPEIESLWAEIMADQSVSSFNAFDDRGDDIWRALGPWFELE